MVERSCQDTLEIGPLCAYTPPAGLLFRFLRAIRHVTCQKTTTYFTPLIIIRFMPRVPQKMQLSIAH